MRTVSWLSIEELQGDFGISGVRNWSVMNRTAEPSECDGFSISQYSLSL
jgi:hypothetical protein